MAAVARRRVTITYSNDVEGEQLIDAAVNADSPASTQLVALSQNDNTITVPDGATCCTIVKPGDNTTAITLKGDTGDTGILLHLTDPDSITIHPITTSFILTLEAETEATVRLFWS